MAFGGTPFKRGFSIQSRAVALGSCSSGSSTGDCCVSIVFVLLGVATLLVICYWPCLFVWRILFDPFVGTKRNEEQSILSPAQGSLDENALHPTKASKKLVPKGPNTS